MIILGSSLIQIDKVIVTYINHHHQNRMSNKNKLLMNNCNFLICKNNQQINQQINQ
jgi:hypothetical protein